MSILTLRFISGTFHSDNSTAEEAAGDVQKIKRSDNAQGPGDAVQKVR